MIITTKPVMASLGTIILCVLIGTANCVIKPPCTTSRDNHFSCPISNDPGVLQFQVMRGSQSSTMDIAVPNLKKDDLGHLALNFTIVGATVGETSEAKDDVEWHLQLSDDALGLAPATMRVQHLDGVTLTSFRWPGRSSPSEDREVCIHLSKDQSWYNTFEQKIQRWPMDLSAEIGSFPLNSVPIDTNTEIGSIVEHLFLSSNGFAILLDRKTPSWLKIVPSATDPQLCITSRNNAPYDSKNTLAAYTDIKFDIYTGANIHDVYDIVSNKLSNIPKPTEIPDDFMFVSPIWSIIAGKGKHFANDVNVREENVDLFIKELIKKGYQNNTLVLETDWEAEKSFLVFNQLKFPNPDLMMKSIHDKGYKLSLLVHPYVKADVADKDTSVKSKSGSEPFLIKNGEYKDRYIVDFSNSKAKTVFKVKLDNLKNYGVDSFVFNSIAFSNNSFTLTGTDANTKQTPAKFVQDYVSLASTYGRLSVVRNGYQTQDKAIYTQMSDRISDWGYQKGLKSLIPTALAMSIGGYSFILPDIVGGRTGKAPSKELYIRWAQATTFFPTMHLSIPPWDYDLDTEEIVKDLVKKRIKHKDLFVNLAQKRMKDGTPMMRPMWFVAPDDEQSYKVEDQFMLGDDLLVAPVLDDKTEERAVYFPLGKWIDSKNKVYSGAGVEQVSAPIDVLPYFTRVK